MALQNLDLHNIHPHWPWSRACRLRRPYPRQREPIYERLLSPTDCGAHMCSGPVLRRHLHLLGPHRGYLRTGNVKATTGMVHTHILDMRRHFSRLAGRRRSPNIYCRRRGRKTDRNQYHAWRPIIPGSDDRSLWIPLPRVSVAHPCITQSQHRYSKCLVGTVEEVDSVPVVVGLGDDVDPHPFDLQSC